MFKAIYLTQQDKTTHAEFAELDEAQLPEGDVDVRVEYSTLNYKDALAITGRGAIVRSWPMVPGIDLAGVVEKSAHDDWKPGQRVVVTGWGLGETRWGGLAQKARLEAGWLLRLPEAYTTRQAMAHRHCRLHRCPVRDGLATPWPPAGRGRGAGHRCSGRRRLDRGGAARRPRPCGGRLHGPAPRGRLPALPGRQPHHRPRRAVRAGQAPAERALGRRGGHGRQPHPGQCLRGDEIG